MSTKCSVCGELWEVKVTWVCGNHAVLCAKCWAIACNEIDASEEGIAYERAALQWQQHLAQCMHGVCSEAREEAVNDKLAVLAATRAKIRAILDALREAQPAKET